MDLMPKLKKLLQELKIYKNGINSSIMIKMLIINHLLTMIYFINFNQRSL